MISKDASGRVPLTLATFFGTGYSPVAPGTAGSLAAIPLVVLIRVAAPMWAELAIIAVLFGVGVWSASTAERLLACDDPGPVVIDEVVGMLMTMVAVPLSWPILVAGFLAFRVMDIVKPYPAGRLERLGGGLGIMADDLAAGVYANLVLQVLVRIRPEWFA